MKKVLSNGPKKVANRGNGSMGSTIGKGGSKNLPKGSDSSKAKVQPATHKARAKAPKKKSTFNQAVYDRMHAKVFGLSKKEDNGQI